MDASEHDRKQLRALLPSQRPRSSESSEGGVVQLSVRVPVELHARARAAAARAGISLTGLVERGLQTEINRMEDPAAQFSDDLAGSIRQRVAVALIDGTWDEAVRAAISGDADLSV